MLRKANIITRSKVRPHRRFYQTRPIIIGGKSFKPLLDGGFFNLTPASGWSNLARKWLDEKSNIPEKDFAVRSLSGVGAGFPFKHRGLPAIARGVALRSKNSEDGKYTPRGWATFAPALDLSRPAKGHYWPDRYLVGNLKSDPNQVQRIARVDAEVRPKSRGIGMGRNMYIHANDIVRHLGGPGLATTLGHSADAEHVWASLARRGLAQSVGPRSDGLSSVIGRSRYIFNETPVLGKDVWKPREYVIDKANIITRRKTRASELWFRTKPYMVKESSKTRSFEGGEYLPRLREAHKYLRNNLNRPKYGRDAYKWATRNLQRFQGFPHLDGDEVSIIPHMELGKWSDPLQRYNAIGSLIFGGARFLRASKWPEKFRSVDSPKSTNSIIQGHVSILPKYQKMGLGRQLYMHSNAVARYFGAPGIATNQSHSRAAENTWRSLARRGFATRLAGKEFSPQEVNLIPYVFSGGKQNVTSRVLLPRDYVVRDD